VRTAPRKLELLMWAGILGAPIVWACQHVFGIGSTLAGCSAGPHSLHVPIDTWAAIVTSVAGFLAICGLVASVLAFVEVRGAEIDSEPPKGRIYFMSICGIVISPLFLAIILMSGIATMVLSNCHQG
jgi:hypothetical protein